MGNCNCRDSDASTSFNCSNGLTSKPFSEKKEKINKNEKYFKPFKPVDNHKEKTLKFSGITTSKHPKKLPKQRYNDAPVIEEEIEIKEKKAKMTGRISNTNLSQSSIGINPSINNYNVDNINNINNNQSKINTNDFYDFYEESLDPLTKSNPSFFASINKLSNNNIKVDNSTTFSIKDTKSERTFLNGPLTEQPIIRENFSYLRYEIVKTSFLVRIINKKKDKIVRNFYQNCKKKSVKSNLQQNFLKIVKIMQIKKIFVNQIRITVFQILKTCPKRMKIKTDTNTNIYIIIKNFSDAVKTIDNILIRQLFLKFFAKI